MSSRRSSTGAATPADVSEPSKEQTTPANGSAGASEPNTPTRPTRAKAAGKKSASKTEVSPTQRTIDSMFKSPVSRPTRSSARLENAESPVENPIQIIPMFTQLSPSPATSSEPPADGSTPSPVAQKRGRGRPPRVPETPGFGMDLMEDEGPRRRGRPPKNPQPASPMGDETSQSPADANVPKRPRGRPPKNAAKPPIEPTASSATFQADDADLPPSKRRKVGEETEIKVEEGHSAAADAMVVVTDEEATKPKAPPKKTAAAPASPAPKKAAAPRKRKPKKSDSDDEVVLSDASDDESLPDDGDAEVDDDDDDAPIEEDADEDTKKRKRGPPSRAPTSDAFQSATKAQLDKLIRAMEEKEDEFLFPRWLPSRKDIRIISEGADEYLPVNAQSRPFVFRNSGDDAPSEPLILERFSTHPRKISSKDAEFDDITIHTGGPIWGLDWCPRSAVDNTRQFLAVSSHRQDDDLHVYGTIYEAKNIIQIWDMGDLSITGALTGSKPRMAFGIAHNGGCAWEIHWCPAGTPCDTDAQLNHPLAPKDAIPRLGLLAGVFADGVVRVWSVPHPDYLQVQPGHSGPLVLMLDPVQIFSCPSSTLFCTVSWSCHDGCDRIAAGGQNGCLAVFRLSDDPAIRSEKVQAISPWGLTLDQEAAAAAEFATKTSLEAGPMHVDSIGNDEGLEWDVPQTRIPVLTYTVARVDVPELFKRASNTALRNVVWSPKHPNYICTTGLDTMFYVWDVSEPFAPIGSKNSNGGFLMSADWAVTFDYESIFIGVTDGETRHNSPQHGRVFKCHDGAVWGLHASPLVRLIASCASDGTVTVFPILGAGLLNGQRRRQMPDPTDIEKIRNQFQVLEFSDGPSPNVALKPSGGGPNRQVPVVISQKGQKKKSLKGMTEEEKKEHRKQLLKERKEKRKELLKQAKLEAGEAPPAEEGAPPQAKPFPPFEVQLHRVRWNLHPKAANWLAYGGYSGLLRIRLIRCGI